MNIITLKTEIARAIDSDDTIKTWCLQNYSQEHKVYSGWDKRNLPDDDDCPCVIFRVSGKSTGRGVEEKLHTVIVKCVVSDSSERTYPGSNNLTEYMGEKNLETFRKYVETSIADLSINNILLDTVDIEYDMDEFPKMSAEMELIFIEPVILGLDPLV